MLLTATARDGIPYIDLGPSDNVAWDQPRVTIELLTDAAGTESVGPQVFNSMLLDTGANTVITMATPVREMNDPPFPYVVEGKFEEIGVAGIQTFDISASYRFDFAGKDGVRNTLLDTRIISDPVNDFSQFGPWGVIGMPTMVDRVTTLDYSVWETVVGLDLFMGVEFREDVPPDNGHRYTIDVDNRLEFDPEHGVVEGCCPPVWGDVPFLTAFPMHNGVPAGGNFLFDTGAQVSVLSERLGLELGLDSNEDGVLDDNDANFARFETVGGIGGAVAAPVFLFDEVHIPTQQGVDLVWTDLQWLVLDIVPGLDGVFGSDLMTSGWLEGFATAGKSGWIDHIQMDFRDMNISGTSEIHFDLNEQVDSLIDPNGAGALIVESGDQTTVSETGVADSYQFVLTRQPTADVTVTLSSPDGELTASDNTNPANQFLTFTPQNWDDPQTVRVAAVNDSQQEAFHRSSIFHLSTSNDPAYQGVGMPRLIANIIDDEFAGVVAIPTNGDTEVSEDGEIDTYDLVLSLQPTQDVTIGLSTVGNQVTARDDLRPSNEFLVFTPSNWNIPQTIRVTAVDDSLGEGDHKAFITHEILSDAPEYQDAFALQEFVNIIDNDTGGISVEPISGLTTSEGSGQDTFTIVLQSEPSADVRIDLNSSDPTEGTAFPTSVTFTPQNFNTPQVITVTGVNDSEVDGDIAYTIETQPAVSSDSDFQGLDGDDVAVVNLDNDVAGLTVTALIPTNTGFSVLFNDEVDADSLNLYDTAAGILGPADVTLTGLNNGPVTGSLFVDSEQNIVTFIKTGGPLLGDSYTVTLHSGENGFKTAAGALLDGNSDGATGDDFTATFAVAPPVPDAVTVSIPDIVRGPGQDVNFPADTNLGIPLSVSEGDGVRFVNLQVGYDPTLLEINAATVADGMPAGSTVALNRPIPGLAIVTFTSPEDLPAGEHPFVNLQARVPTVNADGIYRSQHVLDVHAVTVADADFTAFPIVDDDAIHVVTYFGDISANGRINAADAAQLARVAALLDGGFAATPRTDPLVLGDISGNTRINAADASRVASAAALIPVPEIPPIPAGILGSTQLVGVSSGPADPFAAEAPQQAEASSFVSSGRLTAQQPAFGLSLLGGVYQSPSRPPIYEWIERHLGENYDVPRELVELNSRSDPSDAFESPSRVQDSSDETVSKIDAIDSIATPQSRPRDPLPAPSDATDRAIDQITGAEKDLLDQLERWFEVL